jgi:hypothetical protein
MGNSFLRLATHPFKLRLFLLSKLPSAYFSGVRVRYVDEEKSVVTVPYKWFSTNPFKSTYFACLAMAAEMSTGILAMAHTYEKTPSVSLLVLKVEGNFLKKADGLTTFTCEEGKRVQQMVNEAMSGGKPTQVTMRSVGRNKDDEIVADFNITWGFKVRVAGNRA